MSIKKHIKWGFALGALLLTTPLMADDAAIERGKNAAATCFACHGPEGAGNPAAAWPRIDIFTANYIEKQVMDIKEGRNDSPTMKPMVDPISAEDIADIAAYYASQSADVPAEEADDALLERGEKLALRGDWDNYIPACKSCHGPDNRGVGDAFPSLAGQHASYIKSQINAWKNGARRNDPQNLMLAVAERLSDEDIEAVAAYFAAQDAR